MNTEELYESCLNKLKSMPVIDEKSRVEETAHQLREMNYVPPFLIPVDRFEDFNRAAALKYLNDILETPEAKIQSLPVASSHSPDEIKQRTMEMLIKEFTLLQNLRQDKPEAWDHINELYEDD